VTDFQYFQEFSMRMSRFSTYGLAAVAALAAWASAQAKDFVLQAPRWGAAQDAAVAAAGGTVRYSHSEGIAVVSSDRPGFLQQALRGGVITSGAPDFVIQQAPVRVVEAALSQDVTAVTDTFYPFIQWAPQAIGAPAAWDAGWTGKGVRVAVIDGGVHGTHVDLATRIDVSAARSFVPGGTCETQWNCDTGTFWHGTHVSGIIAAPINNIGIVGIAHEATIVPVKALHGGSGSFGSVILAILYAATEGKADIINMSLGAVFQRREPGAAELTSALNRAVNFAGSRGVLVISSAGNDALDVDHSADYVVTPAQSGNGLAVSATGPFGFGYSATNFARFSSYSNWGNSLVTVAGPGGDFAWPTNENCTKTTAAGVALTRPCWVFDMVMSAARGSGASTTSYAWAAGTSMAAPAAAAVAALIKQKYPGISVGALKTRLMRATTDEGKVGNDPYYGKGFINAAKAVAD
jgi:subtilisin family serine protease